MNTSAIAKGHDIITINRFFESNRTLFVNADLFLYLCFKLMRIKFRIVNTDLNDLVKVLAFSCYLYDIISKSNIYSVLPSVIVVFYLNTYLG